MEHGANHPDAHKGMVKQAQPEGKPFLCPACKGYAGFILKLDAYGPGGFKSGCFQCNGWGWVRNKLDSECIHDFMPTRNLGNCYNENTCTKCGRKVNIDSSG